MGVWCEHFWEKMSRHTAKSLHSHVIFIPVIMSELCCSQRDLSVMWFGIQKYAYVHYISIHTYIYIYIWIWVNIGSGRSLLPDGTKPLYEPVLANHHWCPMAFFWELVQKICSRTKSLTCVQRLHGWNNYYILFSWVEACFIGTREMFWLITMKEGSTK